MPTSPDITNEISSITHVIADAHTTLSPLLVGSRISYFTFFRNRSQAIMKVHMKRYPMKSPLKSLLWGIYNTIVAFGCDPRKALQSLRGLSYYCRDLKSLKRQEKRSQRPFAFGPTFLCLNDRFDQSGTASGHYFHQNPIRRPIHT